jgi:MoaA/NifB/PqqE/SkfB family radical SAM enzyme
MAQLSTTRKKLRLVRMYLSGQPIFCTWQVTYCCNFRCGFCAYWKEEVNYSADARASEATLEDFRLGAAKLGELGALIVNLSGGEPLLRRDLGEIVSAVGERHFPLITTNGWFVTEQNARELWDAGLWGASVSLDFASDERHDLNRGVAGAAERARRAIQILSRTRTRRHQRVNLMCVLNGENLGDIEELIRFAAANEASFMVQPYAAFKSGNPRLAPNANTSAPLLKLKKRHRNFISNRLFLRSFDGFLAGGIRGCMAGRAFFNIDNFMNVQKCVEFREEPVGNLRELEAREMLRRLSSEHDRNRCQACWYNCRGEIESLYSLRGLMGSASLLVR